MNVLHALPPTAFVSLGVRKEGKCKNRHLGCVNPASWLLLPAGGKFTQPSLRLFLHVYLLHRNGSGINPAPGPALDARASEPDSM